GVRLAWRRRGPDVARRDAYRPHASAGPGREGDGAAEARGLDRVAHLGDVGDQFAVHPGDEIPGEQLAGGRGALEHALDQGPRAVVLRVADLSGEGDDRRVDLAGVHLRVPLADVLRLRLPR